MKRQSGRNRFIMYYHEVTELSYSYCRSILKEHHWDLYNFTDYEIQMIKTIFAKYRVDVVDSYVEDVFVNTFKVKTKNVTEEKILTLRKRFAHLLPSHRIGCYVTSCCSDPIFYFYRILPDKLASHSYSCRHR